MQINNTRLENGILKITLAGRLDMKGTMAIETSFTNSTATAKNPVIVDMAEVGFISSMGIRLLLTSAKAAANRENRLVLYNLSKEVLDTIILPGLDQVLLIAEDEQDALAKAVG